MPLLDGVEVPAVELTNEQKTARANAVITQKIRGIATSLARQYNDLMAFVWNHPGGLTPQEVLDACGPRALPMMQLGLSVNELIGGVSSEIPIARAPNELAPEIVNGAPTGRIIVGDPIAEE